MLVKPSRKLRLEAKRQERENRTLRLGELRHDVIQRSRMTCEACWAPVPPGELHHLLGGGGRRRIEERLETVAFLCVRCHHGWHAGHIDVMERLQAWAARHRYASTLLHIQRRLEKALVAARWQGLRTA